MKYHLDHEDALVLTTEYETMTISERFWFVDENIRLRVSTVQRFGGFNTATFCIEVRENEEQTATQAAANKPLVETASVTGW